MSNLPERELGGTPSDPSAACGAIRAYVLGGFAIGFILFGVLWVGVGVHESWPQWSRTSGLPRTEGTVSKLAQGAGDEADILVVDYQAGGQTFRARHKVVLSPGPYSVGQTVGVRYPPDRPEAGVVDTFWETWGLLAMLGGFGAVFVAIGMGMLWFLKRSVRREAAAPPLAPAGPGAADVTLSVNPRPP